VSVWNRADWRLGSGSGHWSPLTLTSMDEPVARDDYAVSNDDGTMSQPPDAINEAPSRATGTWRCPWSSACFPDRLQCGSRIEFGDDLLDNILFLS
jgi:hypothetical protein